MTEWCSCNRLREADEKAAKWDAIVRCGECKHLYEYIGRCRMTGAPADGDHFCAWGERREDA